MDLKDEKQVETAQTEVCLAQKETETTPQELEARLRTEFAATLQQERERAVQEKQAALDTLRRERAEAAAAIALTRAGARNLKAARALLEVDPVGFDGAEQAQAFANSLQAQIDALKAGEDTGFLFAVSAPAFRGFVPAEGRDEPHEDAALSMSLSDAVRRALLPGV